MEQIWKLLVVNDVCWFSLGIITGKFLQIGIQLGKSSENVLIWWGTFGLISIFKVFTYFGV